MSRVLLDSSIIIDFLRQKDKSKTLLVGLIQKKLQLSTSIMTYAESFAGKSVWEEKQVKKDLEILFSDMEILELDINIAQKAGEIRAKYGLSIMDSIIASTAMHNELLLMTLNIKDFKPIVGLELFSDIEKIIG